MKTYIFDSFNRYKRLSESLDIKTILCNKSWWVFNDLSEKELYIFQEDGSLIISLSGIVTNASWKFISANNSLLITVEGKSYLRIPSFIDSIIFALQLDGTEQYTFMINEAQKASFQPHSLSDIQAYFQKKEQYVLNERKIQEGKNKRYEEERQKKIELEEVEKRKKIEDAEKRENDKLELERWEKEFYVIATPETYIGSLNLKQVHYQNIDKFILFALLLFTIAYALMTCELVESAVFQIFMNLICFLPSFFYDKSKGYTIGAFQRSFLQEELIDLKKIAWKSENKKIRELFNNYLEQKLVNTKVSLIFSILIFLFYEIILYVYKSEIGENVGLLNLVSPLILTTFFISRLVMNIIQKKRIRLIINEIHSIAQ